MNNWSVEGVKWIKAELKSGEKLVFKLDDVKYVRSDGEDCEITMNDGKVFGVKFVNIELGLLLALNLL